MNQTLLKTKHSCALSVAKKLFFFAAMLISVATTAQPRTLVKSVGVNYATKQVTFNISWAAGSRGTYGAKIYNSKVWVFVDYQPVTGLIKGAWSRAMVDLSALPAGCTADGSNARGFWYQGQATAAQNANITVTLTNVPAQFNWCAYATDYPPNATANNGVYTFKGSPPFIINGSSTVSATTYTGTCITSITDATGCPGLVPPVFTAGSITTMGEFLNKGGRPITIANATAAAGGSDAVSYKWYKNGAVISGATAADYTPPKTDAVANGTYTYTRRAFDAMCYPTSGVGLTSSGSWTNIVAGPIHPYTGCSVNVAMYDITEAKDYSAGVAACVDLGSGWRLPTASEAQCFCTNFYSLNLKKLRYPSSTPCTNAIGCHQYVRLYTSNSPATCSLMKGTDETYNNIDDTPRFIRCVKSK